VLRRHAPGEPIKVCTGGERRQDSVMAGVAELSPSIEVAIIHDAARPLATPAMFERVAEEARKSGAAITGVPVSDTIKEAAEHMILRTIDRRSLWAAQTPQAYRLALLNEAFGTAMTDEQEFTDEAAMLESLGHPVTVVEGARTNLKVTVPEDLELVEFLLRRRSRGARHVSS
jgi:2-C-methyl-D-erythritol 4-phosphate cytidylyltransferase